MSDINNQEINTDAIQNVRNSKENLTENNETSNAIVDVQSPQDNMQQNICFIIPPKNMNYHQNPPPYTDINHQSYYQFIAPYKNYNPQVYNYSNFSQNTTNNYWQNQTPMIYQADNSSQNNGDNTSSISYQMPNQAYSDNKKYFRNQADNVQKKNRIFNNSYSNEKSNYNRSNNFNKPKFDRQKDYKPEIENNNNNQPSNLNEINNPQKQNFNNRALNYNPSYAYPYYYTQYFYPPDIAMNYVPSPFNKPNFYYYTRPTHLDKYNPKNFVFNGENEGAKDSRFFVIKSYSKDDVIHSIEHSIWCSTETGNKKLNQAFTECKSKKFGSIYLYFSVNSSGHFCGMAEMTSKVDFDAKSDLWAQDKWKGKFDLKWIFVKDIPNMRFKHIILPYNENKPVTNSRDTQEVLFDQAVQVLSVFRTYNHNSTILDDFELFPNNQSLNKLYKNKSSDSKQKQTVEPNVVDNSSNNVPNSHVN